MNQHDERNIFISSASARIIAALVTTIIHELGHFTVSKLLGNPATLYHNRVETAGESLNFLNQLLIPLGGPVISLAQGIICMMKYRKIKNDIGSLLLLWMGISGLMAFFGYLMISPLFSVGDTGKIFQLLEIPLLWQIIIAIASLIFFTYLLTRFHTAFERYIPENIPSGKKLRAKWARLLILYPLLISIPVLTILEFPIVYFLSVLPALTMPFMLFMVYGMMIMSKNNIEAVHNRDIRKLSVPLILLLIASIALNRVLVWGITI